MSRIADSKVKWRPLGEFIEECDERNADGLFGVESVRGISTNKEMIPTVANLEGVALRNYKCVERRMFAYVSDTSRRGGKISLGFNQTEEVYLVSPISTVFSVDESKLNAEFLNLWVLRSEFDRYARFNSWGSARETFNWSEMCRVKIPLPPIEVQRKVVEIWQGLRKLKEENENLAEPLMQLCRSYLQECKKKYPMKEIGPMIEPCDERNEGGTYGVDSVRGVSIEKKLIPTKADMTGVGLKPYKLLNPLEFAVVPVTSRNGGRISLAMNSENETYIVSSAYDVFRVSDTIRLSSEYLYLLLCRPEFDRYARFNSWGSARETFNWSEMCRVKIPLPPIEVQQAIVDVYRCAKEAKAIAEEADRLSREICPALVRYAAESGGVRSAAS